MAIEQPPYTLRFFKQYYFKLANELGSARMTLLYKLAINSRDTMVSMSNSIDEFVERSVFPKEAHAFGREAEEAKLSFIRSLLAGCSLDYCEYSANNLKLEPLAEFKYKPPKRIALFLSQKTYGDLKHAIERYEELNKKYSYDAAFSTHKYDANDYILYGDPTPNYLAGSNEDMTCEK